MRPTNSNRATDYSKSLNVLLVLHGALSKWPWRDLHLSAGVGCGSTRVAFTCGRFVTFGNLYTETLADIGLELQHTWYDCGRVFSELGLNLICD